MRTIVLSDVHGNIDVLRALERQWGPRLESFDRVVCLGDLVDYGPDPADVIEWVRARATDVIAGNHDVAMATGTPCESSPRYLEASIATRERLRPTLRPDHLEFLNRLPRRQRLTVGARTWHLAHATPRDPLHEYLLPEADDATWSAALAELQEDCVLVGHTHLAFVRLVGDAIVVNPGSIGMPKDGHPHGSYVVIDDGAIAFHRIAYDPAPMLTRLRALGLPAHIEHQLVDAFTHGA